MNLLIIVGIAIGLLVTFVIDLCYSFWPRKLEKYNNVIVLGARLHNELKVTKTLAKRLDLAYELVSDEGTIIVSGGQVYDDKIPEAMAMKNYLVDKGFDGSRIIMEDKSKNTVGNINNSKILVSDSNVAIATSKYHVFRVKIETMKNKFKADVYGADAPREILSRAIRRELLAILWKNMDFFLIMLMILILWVLIYS